MVLTMAPDILPQHSSPDSLSSPPTAPAQSFLRSVLDSARTKVSVVTGGRMARQADTSVRVRKSGGHDQPDVNGGSWHRLVEFGISDRTWHGRLSHLWSVYENDYIISIGPDMPW